MAISKVKLHGKSIEFLVISIIENSVIIQNYINNKEIRHTFKILFESL
jgi:hypothetical protein